jgi:hypothetical protein
MRLSSSDPFDALLFSCNDINRQRPGTQALIKLRTCFLVMKTPLIVAEQIRIYLVASVASLLHGSRVSLVVARCVAGFMGIWDIAAELSTWQLDTTLRDEGAGDFPVRAAPGFPRAELSKSQIFTTPTEPPTWVDALS